MQPAFIYCDFESCLLKALQGHFPALATLIIGCQYHFKQALRRRLKKDRISEPECEIEMEPEVLDMLTTTQSILSWHRLSETESQKRVFIRQISCTSSKWALFWNYFHRMVGLSTMRHSHGSLGSENSHELRPEFTDELGVAIRMITLGNLYCRKQFRNNKSATSSAVGVLVVAM